MKNKLMSFTVFLDILGFGSKVSKITNEIQAKDFVTFMQSNKKIFEITSSMPVLDYLQYYEVKFAFISDSIVIHFNPKELNNPINEEQLYYLSSLFFISLCNKLTPLFFNLWTKERLLLRGGISSKFSYIENEFVVGEGLMEAYTLEGEKAKYPRIILSSDISDNKFFLDTLKSICQKQYKSSKYIIKKDEEDSLFFIDYLNMWLNQEGNGLLSSHDIKESNKKLFKLHQEAIQSMKLSLNLINDNKKKEKLQKSYDWIKNYHNKNVPPEFFIR